MENKISEFEVRQDLLHIKDQVPSKSEKLEIGLKYGLPKEKCGRSENIIKKIYSYLQYLRNNKTEYTQNDIHDFYGMINGAQKYQDLESFLMYEPKNFIKYLLEYLENTIQTRSTFTQYIKQNAATINIKSKDCWDLSSNDKTLLERYQSVKKYYELKYSLDSNLLQSKENNKTGIENKLLEDTYEIKMDLEQFLVDFINNCYDKYNKGESNKNYIEFYKLQQHYQKLVNDLQNNRNYAEINNHPENEIDEYNEQINEYNTYIQNLHFLMIPYTYFREETDSIGRLPIPREKRIDLALEYFNKEYEKLIYKNITRTLLLKNALVDTIEIGGLEKTDFGYCFTVNFAENKKLYVNFILNNNDPEVFNPKKKTDTKNYLWKNLFPAVCYIMQVTLRPYQNKVNLNESFNYNTRFALDDFDNDEELQGQTSNKTNHYKGSWKEYLNIKKEIVDLGLPSGTLWCKYNLGVNINKLDNAKDWIGNYYAWGETEPKLQYDWSTYKYAKGVWNKLTKYGDNVKYNVRFDKLNKLEPDDDAAIQKLTESFNFNFYIPSKIQFEELIKNTKIKFEQDYQGIAGLNGVTFISKINKEELFMPYTNIMEKDKLSIYKYGGYYWTCENIKGKEYIAYELNIFKNVKPSIKYIDRSVGLQIRAVVNKEDINNI